MGLLTFSLNVTLDGCVDHQEGIADDETHAFFTRLMDEGGAMLWGRVTYEMMESYWPAVARGDEPAPPALREWAVKLETKPKYVVSSTRTAFPWTNSHHLAGGGDLRAAVQRLKDATPAGVLLGSGRLATRAGPPGPDRRVPVPGPSPHRRPRPHPPRARPARHAPPRADLRHAAPQRRRRHPLPPRPLIGAADDRCGRLPSPRYARRMADVVYLPPDQQMPDIGDDQPWLTIEASRDGRFFGTGASFKADGEWVGYGSLAEDDVSLETALTAAQKWAAKYGVPTIWVQLTP